MSSLSPGAFNLLVLIGGLLLLAGAIILALRPLQIAGYANIVLRNRSWWLIVIVFGGGMVAHPISAWLLVTALSLWSLHEFYRLVPGLQNSRLPLIGYGGVFLLTISASLGDTESFHLSLVGCLLATVILAVLEGEPRASIARIGSAMLGTVVITWTLAHLLLLRNASDGVTMVLLLCVLTALNDVFAYVAGRLWGRRRLAAQISPNKTLEGWLGGAFSTVLLAGLLCSWLALPLVLALVLGCGVACLGALGDLTISLFKRDVALKDTGTLLAGHGGLLDRLDSLLFVAPFSVYILRLFPLASGV